MPAQSKQQQKFMGLVHAIQKGDVPSSDASPEVLKVAKDMKPSDVKDFASTSHKGLPKRVKQEILKKLKEYAMTLPGHHAKSAAPMDSLRSDDEMDVQETRIPQNFNVGTTQDYHTKLATTPRKKYDKTNFKPQDSGQPDLEDDGVNEESELKGYLAVDVVDDIVKSIGLKFVSGQIKNTPNRNYIYLKLNDIKFGSGVVKMLKSKFGIDAKVDYFGGKGKFGSIPAVVFPSNKVISESIKEAQAVSGGKVHKFITGKNLGYKGKKYSQIEFETLGVDNKNGTVRFKILAPKEIFGNEISLDFRSVRRGPYFKTDTSKVNEASPCWDGYKQVGMKTKGGKQVPNCVKESVNELKLNDLVGNQYKYVIGSGEEKYLGTNDKKYVLEMITKALETYLYDNNFALNYLEGSQRKQYESFFEKEVLKPMLSKIDFTLNNFFTLDKDKVKWKLSSNDTRKVVDEIFRKNSKIPVDIKREYYEYRFDYAGVKLKESSKADIIKDLDKAKNDLLKKVDVLIAKKKKLYSNVDIESPMSADEKKLDKDIADLFSQINKLVLQKRNLKEYGQALDLHFILNKDAKLDGTPEDKDVIDKNLDEVGLGDWHFKAIEKMYQKAGAFTRKKIAALITKNPNSSWDKISKELRGSDYNEVTYYTDRLGLGEVVNHMQSKTIKEDLSFDEKQMVIGIIEILKQVEDRKNRMKIALNMLKKFKEEGIEFDYEKFIDSLREYSMGSYEYDKGNRELGEAMIMQAKDMVYKVIPKSTFARFASNPPKNREFVDSIIRDLTQLLNRFYKQKDIDLILK